MYQRIVFMVTIAVCCTSANAQYANVDGKFRSASVTLDLIPLDSEKGVIAAATTVVQGACSGSIAGIGKVSGNELKFSPYVKEDNSDTCEVTVVFDKKRNSAKISAKSCTAHSGASCGWEGDTMKRAK
ncbi:hypothetical protein [Duganella radicis]|uniref:Uncharacterized protein n=1 Tax=Duganella radicis TaxID=551988 RepID=A0A6L6PJA3_9BURK|nr:hypothetical protein [Duganella radicis]MTV39140.1 hypothetical protein [Duganella radicis]